MQYKPEFLAGWPACSYDVSLSQASLDTRAALEEERRLFYVAVTRAKDELYLAYPHMRLTGGYGDVFQRPSRFLKEIPNELVEDWQVRKG